MKLSESFLQELKYRCDIEQVVARYVNLRKQGGNAKGLCPFHNEKTPSLTVYNDTQSFYCFGCGAGGDVITFIRRIENLDYIEAVKFLAQQAGMDIPDAEMNSDISRMKKRILEINRESARFFYSGLFSEQGKDALVYLKNRGLQDITIKKFGLGYAPDSFYALSNYLKGKGFTEAEIKLANVAREGKKGGIYDFFRNRIMFPIIDLRGNVIAFGGRILTNEKGYKYLNSPDTLVFKKSQNAFALQIAKNHQGNSLVLAEGYMDVISMHQAGVTNAVATLGTALTDLQAQLLRRYADEIIVAYDADPAGQEATKRAIGILTAAGLNVRILKLEGAKDPDEYIKKSGADRFIARVQSAGNQIEYQLEQAKKKYVLQDNGDKVKFLSEAVRILSKLENMVECEVYAGNLAVELNITKEALLQEVKKEKEKSTRIRQKKEMKRLQTETAAFQDKINPEKHQFLRAATAEEGLIAFLIYNPDMLEKILSRISENDFLTQFNGRVMSEVVKAITNTGNFDISSVGNVFTAEEMGRITSIMLKNRVRTNNIEAAYDCVKVLKDEKAKLDQPAAGKMDPAAFSKYIREIASRKINGGDE